MDGVFAFIILDVANKKVHIGRDTLGVRPCFRFCTPSGFLAICSEAKGNSGASLEGLLNQSNFVHIKLFILHCIIGINGLIPDGSNIRVTPLFPGHYESYDLLHNGKVTLNEQGRFHKVGQLPAYKTTECLLGNYKNNYKYPMFIINQLYT